MKLYHCIHQSLDAGPHRKQGSLTAGKAARFSQSQFPRVTDEGMSASILNEQPRFRSLAHIVNSIGVFLNHETRTLRVICLGELANFPTTYILPVFWCPRLWRQVLLSCLTLPFIFPSEFLFLYELLFVFLPNSALQFDSHIHSKTKPTVRLNSGLWTFYLGKCQKNFPKLPWPPPTHIFKLIFIIYFLYILPYFLSFLFLFHSILLFWHDFIQDTQSYVRGLSACPSAMFFCVLLFSDGSYHTLCNYLSVFRFKCQDLSS